jgi:hypothetical protein
MLCYYGPRGCRRCRLVTDRCHSHDSTRQFIWKPALVGEYGRTLAYCHDAEPSIIGSKIRLRRTIYLRVRVGGVGPCFLDEAPSTFAGTALSVV